MFKCQECGRKFKSTRAAEKASYNGCPGCGGTDIDIDVVLPPEPAPGATQAGYLIGTNNRPVAAGVVCRCDEAGVFCPAHGR